MHSRVNVMNNAHSCKSLHFQIPFFLVGSQLDYHYYFNVQRTEKCDFFIIQPSLSAHWPKGNYIRNVSVHAKSCKEMLRFYHKFAIYWFENKLLSSPWSLPVKQTLPKAQRTQALRTLTHLTPLVQSRSFNNLWNLGQTSVWFCLEKGEKYIE